MPRPPTVPRRWVSTGALHTVALAILLTLPVLGLVGAFGERDLTREVRAGPLVIQVEYPRLTRLNMDTRLTLRIRNRAETPSPPLVARVSPTWLSSLSQPETHPPLPEPLELHIPTLNPGETQVLTVGLSPARGGLQRGDLTFQSPDGAPQAELRLTTFTFP